MSWLDAEVRNGGFSQYFFNSSGDLAEHAVDAAKAVGATKAARVIQKAVALFGPDPDCDERMDQLSAISLAALEKLDTRYYDCFDNLRELLPLYVARHADEFRSRSRRG